MAYIEDQQELYELYTRAKIEADQWKIDYPEFERLADNDLIDNLDESLPEVNDGSLAAALFKLPKRIVSSNLIGIPKALDRDEPWITELAKIVWENTITKKANSQAQFHRKWKDAVRKSAIYGGIPIVNFFTERGNYTGSDFIVASAYDVALEPGKLSDYDSDIIFWDIYMSDSQLDDLIDQAKEETKEAKQQEKKYEGKEKDDDYVEPYNTWDVNQLQAIKAAGMKDEKTSNEIPNSEEDKSIDRTGYHFYVAFQRGVSAPFAMCHNQTKSKVRNWTNPDPTGDIPVHYLFAYQDLINPYGVGICKLAAGTQNVLDYMRQSDVLATQLGLRPPKLISGDMSQVDEDSLVYAEDANWWVGNADVKRQELANGVYTQLPNRIAMYKTSLNQLIPTGDTSISASAGDPQYSKTPAGVKFQAANLSIDDEDFKDNFYLTYEAVASSMINVHFANMQGEDLIKLSDEEREILSQGGLNFENPDGESTNELEVAWDTARAEFDFEIEAEIDRDADDKEKLQALLQIAELKGADPTLEQALLQSNKRLNVGELFAEIIKLTSDNEKIIEDIAPEDGGKEGQPGEEEQPPEEVMQAAQQNIQGVMEQYGVDEQTAAAALEAEQQGYPPEQIIKSLQANQGGQNVQR